MRVDAIQLQRAYYAATAAKYDSMHVQGGDAHTLALGLLTGFCAAIDARSVLDIGSGTGRGVLALQKALPKARVIGIEPSPELRAIGFDKGISASDLLAGDATALQCDDGAFDVVCEFGALHHIPDPSRAVAEMLRAARQAIFISDCNNFGDGSALARAAKQTLRAAGLWKVVDFVKTRGRGYMVSEGDGVAYSYSVFNDLPQIRRACRSVHLIDSGGSGRADLYRGASHVAVLAIKA